MRKQLGRLMTVWVTAGLTVGLAQAQDLPQIFHMNPARSSVTFLIPGGGDAPNGTVHGSFKVRGSSIRFMQADKRMTGQIVVAAASERSGAADHDRMIRSKVLEAKRFATITFAPTRYEGGIERTGVSTIQVHGTLTLEGKPQEMTVPVEVQSNGFEFSATAKIMVPNAEWGVPDLGAAGLPGSAQVEVNVKLVGYVSPRN